MKNIKTSQRQKSTEPKYKKYGLIVVIFISMVLVWFIIQKVVSPKLNPNNSEATQDYEESIRPALKEYFDARGEYPKNLKELGLPDEAIKANNYYYSYYGANSSGNASGPSCTYNLSYNYPDSFGLTTGIIIARTDDSENNRCDEPQVGIKQNAHDSLVEQKMQTAKNEISNIQNLLEQYRSSNGGYPDSLSKIGSQYTVSSVDSIKFKYSPYAANKNLVYPEEKISEEDICGYLLDFRLYTEDFIQVGANNNGGCAPELMPGSY